MTENRTKIIAEIGWNHMGDVNLAKEFIDAAKESGADYAKFQTWSVKNLKNGPWDSDGRKEIYQKAELTKEMHEELFEYCIKKKIKFLTSIFNFKDIYKVENLDLNIIKLPSHEIYNLNLIKNLSLKYEKILVSTGAAKWEEIIKISKLDEFEKIVFLHCVSSYPCNFDELNFNKFFELKNISKNEVGYSGHFHGIKDAIIAITLHASFVEKHFTIDNNLPGRDNKFAILPKDLKELTNFNNDYSLMLSKKNKDLQENEMDIYNNYRGRWG
ncbi:N-acetylneuraminate synthase family protein [Candidatus Pelagibacter sp.]|nr:N-acetylneuraminate synthase family protein [Candidatus Pelagibacter sp.]